MTEQGTPLTDPDPRTPFRWYAMDPDRFKAFCDGLLIEEFGVSLEVMGAKGRDTGVDAQLPDGMGAVQGRCVFQYKFVDTRLSPSSQRSRLEKLLKKRGKGHDSELGKPGPMSSRHFFVLTSAELNPQFCEKWRKLAVAEKAGYQLHFWDRARLDQMLAKHPRLQIHFGAEAPYPPGKSWEAPGESPWKDFALETPRELGLLLARDQQFLELLDVVKNGEVCLVQGVAGIGKSHLLSTVACSPEHGRPVFWYTLRPGLPNLERLTAHLLAFAEKHSGKQGAAALPNELHPLDRARMAFGMVAKTSALICLDDAHVATDDQALTSFLSDLLNHSRGTSILVASRYDTGLSAKLHTKTRIVTLSGLGKEPSGALLEQCGVHELNDVLAEVYEWTQGNPKLLQLAAAWLNMAGRKPIALRELMANMPGGTSIDRYILTEIYTGLSTEEQAALRALSVMRASASAQELSYVAGIQNGIEVIDGLRRKFLLDSTSRLVFPGALPKEMLQAHPMVKDFCRTRVTRDHEEVCHRRAAVFLAFHADGVEDRFEAGFHFSKLSLWSLAVGVLHNCVELLLSRGYASVLVDFLRSVPTRLCRDADRLWLLWALGTCAEFQGRPQGATRHFTDMRDAARVLGLLSFVQSAETGLGSSANQQGNHNNALEHYQSALRIAMKLQDLSGMGRCYHNIGNVYMALGKPDQAKPLLEKDLDICVHLGDDLGAATTLSNLATVHAKLGDLVKAKECATKSLTIRQEKGDMVGVGFARLRFAELACEEQQWEAASRLAFETEPLAKKTGDVRLQLACLDMLATVEQRQGRGLREIELRQQILHLSRQSAILDVAAATSVRLAALYAEHWETSAAVEAIQGLLKDERVPLGNEDRVLLLCLCASISGKKEGVQLAVIELSDALREPPSREHDLFHPIQLSRILLAVHQGRAQDAERYLLEVFDVAPHHGFWTNVFPHLLDISTAVAQGVSEKSPFGPTIRQISCRPKGAIDGGLRAFSLVLLGDTLCRSGKESSTIDAYTQAAADTKEGADWGLVYATAEVRLGWLWHRRRQSEIALAHIENGIATLRQIGDCRRLAGALARHGDALITAGSPARAITVLREAELLTEDVGIARDLAQVKLSMAMASGSMNELNGCREKLDEAKSILGENDWPDLRGIAAFIEGNLAKVRGDYCAASGFYRRAIDELSKADEQTLLVYARASLASLRLRGW